MTMREKIARAMHEADLPLLEGWTSWEENLPSERESYMRRADAALDALLEPTDDMFWIGNDLAVDNQGAALIFDAMIRAAKEGK